MREKKKKGCRVGSEVQERFGCARLWEDGLEIPGGRLDASFSAFSGSSTTRVYRYREQRILNLVTGF